MHNVNQLKHVVDFCFYRYPWVYLIIFTSRWAIGLAGIFDHPFSVFFSWLWINSRHGMQFLRDPEGRNLLKKQILKYMGSRGWWSFYKQMMMSSYRVTFHCPGKKTPKLHKANRLPRFWLITATVRLRYRQWILRTLVIFKSVDATVEQLIYSSGASCSLVNRIKVWMIEVPPCDRSLTPRSYHKQQFRNWFIMISYN